MIPVIAIIGAGNMGRSLIGGLINHQHPSDQIWAADADEEKLTSLKHTFHIQTTTNNAEAVKHADIIILAIKPQLFATVVPALAPALNHDCLVISIAAGIRIASIEQWLGDGTAIVRSMPNTPALINCGATALYANPSVSKEQRQLAESILQSVGIVVWLDDEKLMDVVTALSGSGPAYFFLMLEVLQNAAEEMGLPHDTAKALTLQTALGAVRMACESDKTLIELRKNVTSPGGTTEKALSILEKEDIRGLFKSALNAARLRSEELAKSIVQTGEKN